MKKSFFNTFLINLTYDQKIAANSFKAWLDKPYEGNPFVLSGYAGTGKTFLSIKLLSFVETLNICWTVVAPTHKAVGVLKSALSKEGVKPTWYPSTVHRLLRLKLKRKGDVELCERTEQTAHSLEQLGLVLIDEASMVDATLLEIILECADLFKTRLVFVGDPAQLPPVGECQSLVFTLRRTCQINLSEVVRHQGPVLKLASCLREGSIPCVRPPLFPVLKTSKGLVASVDKKSWLKKAKDALRSASDNDDPDAARILCYTNRSLEFLVPHARRAIHGEMAEQLPVLPGEVLISRSAVMAPASINGSELGEEPDIVLGSNRELVVKDVTPESFDLASLGDEEKINFQLPLIDTLLVKASSGELELTLRLLPAIGTRGRSLIDQTLQKLRNNAREVDKNEGRFIWRKFFLIRDAFASLGPASVLTVHRSQGSTFGEVYVANDVFWPKDLNLRRQLTYVAVSRARKGVWLEGGNDIPDSSNRIWREQFALMNTIKDVRLD